MTDDDPYHFRDKSDVELAMSLPEWDRTDLRRAAVARNELERRQHERQHELTRSAMRPAKWAAAAAIASAVCAVILAAVGVASLVPDNQDTAFARCAVAQASAARSPPDNFLSLCMTTAGYHDWCRDVPPGSAPGQTANCFYPEGWRTRLLRSLRGR